MKKNYLESILTAQVYDVAEETPLENIPNLSERIHNQVLLKREDLQQVFSFKLRGAYNKMLKLSPEVRNRGVVAASAGNHAQGVALAAKKLGCSATIVMPVTTPQIKVQAVMARGATVVLYGDSYNDAYDHAMELTESQQATFIHPYDDPDVIAGQGTIGMEILRQHTGKIHAIFVPVGGGGLIAGIAVYVKRLYPETKIIGVEPVDANALYRSLQSKRRVKLSQVGLFADGVAVKQVGRETFRLCREFVDEVILVDTDAVCAAIKDVFEDTRSILEPSGALSIAGLKTYVERENILHETLIGIASGANMNFDRLRHISERAEIGEHREAVMAVSIPEKPGSFKKFCNLLGAKSITEFNYRYADPKEAHVFVGVSVRNREETEKLIADLQKSGLSTEDLSNNEMAKLHIRHLVGGHAPEIENEILYRFEFPDRPGALMNFLNAMSHNWNISLFHYRNHGADYGRVLIGIQVPPEEKSDFKAFLDQLGYHYWDESKNPAYKLFLG
ncbi:MAG: threonine ammonia-lyase, biosynthetic [Burkholderiales bacterium]|uniref:threonine ammonia-lyase, biosynthetic n=1 Tax=Nitrosomonas sp. TaxID=42353 RepID=UPI001DA462F4|nr:threonine ammonia-lyase, biosynthetic [Nitrosomonas sp.]MCB1947734.1 threonine ammonia-lyase, biosynthetic [Nitrosomonas sp.]MCP5242080.1 threonine ammonia-lyase, biosynthetic [Burkholderiales bacterium]